MRLRVSSIAAPGILLLGCAVTAGIFWEMRSSALHNQKSNFSMEASQRAERIVDKLQHDFVELDALRRLFEGSEVVEPREFILFAEPILKGETDQRVFWVPCVRRESLKAFEEFAHSSGLSDYSVRELNAKLEPVPVGARDEYFPLLYSEPSRVYKDKEGIDLGTDAELLDAMSNARRTAKPSILLRVLFPGGRLVSSSGSDEPNPSSLALIIVPVYYDGTRGEVPRDESLQGFVIGEYDLGKTIEHVIEEIPALGMPTSLVDLESEPAGRTVYEHLPRLGTRLDSVGDLWFNRDFAYAGHRYRINVQAGSGFVLRHPVDWPYTIVPLGLLCSCLAGLLVQTQLAGRRRAESLVARRTEELQMNEHMLNGHARILRLLIHSAGQSEFQLREALSILGETTQSDIVSVCTLEDVSETSSRFVSWCRVSEITSQRIHTWWRDALSATGPWRQTLQSGESVRASALSSPATGPMGDLGVKSMVAIPFSMDGRLGGVLGLLRLERDGRFSDSEVRVLESTAHSIGLTLERHEAERQLRTLADRLRLATAAADVGIWDWDLAEDRLVWDRRLAEMHGIDQPPEREIVAQWVQRVHPEDVGRLMEQAHCAVHVEGALDAEYRIIRPDGEERYVRSMATVSKDEDGQPTRMTGVIWDITERKKADDQRRESERFIRAVLDAVPAHICVLDQSGTILAVNHAWHELARLMGEPPKSVSEGVQFLHVVRDIYRIDEEYARAFEDALSSLTRGDRDESILEYQCKVKGATRWFIAKVLPIPQSRPPRILVVHEDVTLLKNALEERIEMERRVLHTQKLESLGVLAGGIAHDFNNLLMVILGNLDIAVHDLAPGSPEAECISEAVQAARRAADLSRQMLAYTGKGRYLVHPVDLNALVAEIAQLLRVSISKSVVLELGLATQLPSILADSAQLQQIVMNLITNASEAIGGAVGHIHIATGVAEYTESELSRSCLAEPPPAGHFIYLDVRDSGCGMDLETRQRLFDPFFTTKFTGRGLGMAAVLGIVRGHGGAIFVDSEPGRGTAIRVLFPAMAEEELRHEETGERPSADIATADKPRATMHGTVLVVDDEVAVRNLCTSMLTRIGLNVLQAEDGEQALQMCHERANEISVVLLDLTMPKMDGMAVFAEVRKSWPDMKVVLSSGYSEDEIAKRFPTEGLKGFIQKPYTLRVLRETLERIMNGSAV